ncbi:MAG TPA: 3-deoxy-7-phosphoheptulonate synthase [Terriglobia bacterium]|jgi:3-deoxy-7-phosphoheptulonate synthase|nr:3-deoxy-7-phosphoheptulonate synthase [Terriglobia bacterium]
MNIAGKLNIDDLPQICPTLSRKAKKRYAEGETRVVQVLEVCFGADQPVVIAGPCAVESRKQTLEVAFAVKLAGAHMLRGGAYKPRTAPHDFQGLGLEGLKILREAREETGLPVVTEVMDPRLVEQVANYADMLQVGSRNMQNYPLLTEVGRCGKPVLLKRGMAASLCEWLGAAEYIASQGNLDIVLCERGIKAFACGEYSRNVLDLNVIHAVKQETFLPIIVDPSHATGVSAMVEPASRAAIEFGAQGLIIEVAAARAGAERPKCDAAQAISPETLANIVEFIKARAAYRAGKGQAQVSSPATPQALAMTGAM